MPKVVALELGITIKPCTDADIPALLPLAAQYYLEDEINFDAARFTQALSSALQQNRGSAWWLCANGERAGYALMMDSWSIEYGGLAAELDEIYVLPVWRGRGVASAAILALRDLLHQRGGILMSMETTPDNLAAQKLYRRLGFADTMRPVFRQQLPR